MGRPPFLDFPLGGMVIGGVSVARTGCGGVSMGDWNGVLRGMSFQCGRSRL